MNKSLRTFYTLVVTQTFSAVGSAMTNFAIGVWIYTKTGNTTPLLLAGVFTWLPYMLFSGIAGVFADRLSRKWLIIYSDLGQAIPTFLLMLSFWTDSFAVWQLYAAALTQSMFSLIQGPSISASITMLVPDNHRDRANAILQVMGPSANLLAPVLGGFLYAFVRVQGVMLIDLLTFFVAVGVIYFVHIPQPTETEESKAAKGSIWKEMRGGWQFLWSRRPLLILSCYFLFLNFITAGVWRLMSPYMLALNGNNERLVGVLMAISSFGLVTGGLITIVWQGTRPRIHTIMPTLALAGIGLVFFGLSRHPLSLGLVAFLMMLPYKMTNALLSSIQQAKIPPDMQGRVFGLLSQISIFALPLSLLLTGPIIDEVLEPAVKTSAWHVFEPFFGNHIGSGMGVYIATCGLILTIATLAVYSLPVIRQMEANLPDYKPIETALGTLSPQAA